MTEQDCLTRFEWSNKFYTLQEWGRRLIDQEAVDRLYANSKEAHMVAGNHTTLPTGLSIPLPIDRVLLSVLRRGEVGKIHKDGLDRRCALNIPISGFERGTMQWFDREFTQMIETYTKTVVRSIRNDSMSSKEQGVRVQSVIDRPTVVNTDVWHRIDNSENPVDRYVLSFRFQGNPDKELLSQIIRNWIRK